ncbi:polysaccharide biosynthesis tyrosine autokinase [Pedobacter sp. SD-b]|uniref:non-specific protein-tyrosine kinase n=1 Tax=Pedobacter segetis TaxID=2793069 RepID=A0ABS1BGY5_9SPHI|nr:tyrosine-protein kinase family protein [Pedobacter segetis]MBK0382124.1 polysaccharide biosynthesis tyrosine autokinase [Pedobacter segetis]
MEEKMISKNKQEIDYGKFAKIILSRWYWIAATLILSLLVAYIYLWYTPKVYSTSAYLKFEEKQANLSNSVTLSPQTRNYTNKILSESWTFRSRKTIEASVNYIDWQVSYFLEGKVRTVELYPQKPFLVQILKQDSSNFYNQRISLIPSNKGLVLSYFNSGKEITNTYQFGDIIKIPGIIFYIKKITGLSEGAQYLFKFNHKREWYGRLGSGLSIGEAAKYSSIAAVSKIDGNAYFAADALNAVMKVYLQQGLDEKTQSAKQIINFIDSQLGNLSNAVQNSGERLKDFKQKNNFFELGSTASTVLGDVTTLEAANKAADLQLLQLQQLQKQFQKNKEEITLNFNLDGSLDPLLSNLLTQWNSLIQERASLVNTFKEGAKPVEELDAKLNILREAAGDNIKATKNRIELTKKFNEQELAKSYGDLKNLPQQERDLFGLQRDYNINEKIFSYLSEKKLEAQISKASILPDASIVDLARPNFSPISPVSKSIWQFAWIIGLGSGVGLIFLARMLNPYIYDKETIESLTNTPIVGMIRHFPEKIDPDNKQILTISKPKSIFAESVRSVRTNLSFIASEQQSKVICISSEIAGEGKSFVTINLASSLALIDKKVIFIAADLRRSKVHKTFGIKDKKGLSTYLAHQDELGDIIHQTQQENLDLIVAGVVPPNPAELMYSDRLQTLIEELKASYDFILFDTAPIGLVSDALPLIRMSDINLFVIRTGKSKYSAASIPNRIANEYHLKNTFIILNDFRQVALHSNYYTTKYSENYYGYYYSESSGKGYGYYNDDHVVSWWKKLWGKL